jgi:TPP-dependent pyruvate/acetoin dehydrogenase alpha subunit
MKKQHEAIKKFENELLEAGLAGGELEEIRNRAIRAVNARKAGMTESRANPDPEEANVSHHTEEDEVEDRTRERYDTLLGEVALFQKMLTDHEKQFAQAEEDKQ